MQKDTKTTLRGLAEFLLEFAHFAKRVGELETRYPPLPTLIGPEAMPAWARLGEQLYRLEENDFITLMRIFYKIAKLPRYVEKLPASEKVTLGKELEVCANELLQIVGEA